MQTVVSKLREPICLLGGWAVFLTVGENFRREHGRDYLGSRDIDLGFHINKEWSRGELETSNFAIAIKALKEIDFEPLSFRLVKHFHAETKQELKGETARRTSSYEMFDLFVDPVVDHIHPAASETFGFIPIDEPLLKHVFVEQKFKIIDLFSRKAHLPLPHVLLATKIKSVSQRDKKHKRVKDIADIYALSWYSDEKLTSLRTSLASIITLQETKAVVESFTKDDLAAISNALDIEAHQIQRVLNELRPT